MKEAKKDFKIERIVYFTLESFYSSAAINKIVEKYKDKVVLICASQRFGGKYGSFFHQFRKNLGNSGFYFVDYISFHFVYYKIFIYISDIINWILRKPKKVYSLSQLSKKYNIPIVRVKEINSAEKVEMIKKHKPDLIIVSFFDHLLKKEIIEIPKYGVINIHPGKLPEYRGLFSSFWQVINNNPGVCATVHWINERFDEGDILKQSCLQQDREDSILSMDYKSLDLGSDLLFDVIEEIECGENRSTKQVDGRYFSYPSKEDVKIIKDKEIKLFKLRDFFKIYFT